jgi:hypothetical protein
MHSCMHDWRSGAPLISDLVQKTSKQHALVSQNRPHKIDRIIDQDGGPPAHGGRHATVC